LVLVPQEAIQIAARQAAPLGTTWKPWNGLKAPQAPGGNRICWQH